MKRESPPTDLEGGRRPMSPARRRGSRLALVLLLPLVASCGAASDLPFVESLTGCDLPTGPAEAMSDEERALAYDVLNRTNAERAAASVPPLAWSEEASRAAWLHCRDMDWRHYFAHESPEGETVGHRLTAQGVRWLQAGENLSRGPGRCDAEQVVRAWMDSPTHREVLLSPLFTHLGVGVRGGGDGPWWAQAFYRPIPEFP
jgi:uncharacterized protein YkwD